MSQIELFPTTDDDTIVEYDGEKLRRLAEVLTRYGFSEAVVDDLRRIADRVDRYDTLPNPAREQAVHGRRATSRAAYYHVLPRTGTQRQKVLNIIAQTGGLTDQQISERLGMALNTVHPRRGELVEDGWVMASNRTRKTRAGEDAIVWCLTPYALEYLNREVQR